MIIREQLMTVEEFWERYADQPYELIEGEVFAMPPTGLSHGFVSRRVVSQLGDFADQHQLGDVVGAETGFQLSETTVRAADAAFISNEKLATVTDPEKFAPFAPDLAVEIVSPNESAYEIRQKVRAYLEAGTALVWVIYPDSREVIVHYPDGTAKTASEDGTLDGGDVLPGLAIRVADLFPPTKE